MEQEKVDGYQCAERTMIMKNFNSFFERIYSIIVLSLLVASGTIFGLMIFGAAPSMEAAFYALRKTAYNDSLELPEVFWRYWRDNFIRANISLLMNLIPIAVTVYLLSRISDYGGIPFMILLVILCILVLTAFHSFYLSSLLEGGPVRIYTMSLSFVFLSPFSSLFILLISVIMYYSIQSLSIILILSFISGLIITVIYHLNSRSFISLRKETEGMYSEEV